MEKKSPYLVVAVAVILLVIAVVWLVVINPKPSVNPVEENLTTPAATDDAVAPSEQIEAVVNEIDNANLDADFSELDQLQQELDEINLDEDLIPTL